MTVERHPASKGSEKPAAVRSTLVAAGWRQGRVLPGELASHVIPLPHAPSADSASASWYVVISQDCDVVSGNLDAEPAAEVLRLQPIKELGPNYIHLRNPREYHFEARLDGDPQPVAARVWDRGFLDRGLLLSHTPDPALYLSPVDITRLATFVGRRYDRIALPDAFVERFRGARAKIEKLLRKYPREIATIFLGISPEAELGPDVSYELRFYVVLADEIVDGNPSTLAGLRKQLRQEFTAALRKCSGVDLEIVLVLGRDDVSLRDLAGLLPLDLDALSSELAIEGGTE